MDSILFIGDRDKRLQALLVRLGYAVDQPGDGEVLADLIAHSNFDLVLIDGRFQPDNLELCAFLRSQERTRTVPILFLASEVAEEQTALDELGALEVVDGSLSVGTLAGKIATQLRLRKTAGQDEEKSSLAEVNAALRDYNARFKKEIEDARTIHQSLLPKNLPVDPRFQIAVSYHPLEDVGGDWYFVSKSADGMISLQIADVTGHGLAAAFLGSMTKLAMSVAGPHEPDTLIRSMNRILSDQLPPGRFVTFGSALYNPENGELCWARAGHPPAMVLHRAAGEVEQLVGEGFALGFVEEFNYSLLRTVLAPGDILLMYTDGISEAQNRSMDQYGRERLSNALCSTGPEASASEALEHILDDFDLFREQRIIKDDVTVLVLKRLK